MSGLCQPPGAVRGGLLLGVHELGLTSVELAYIVYFLRALNPEDFERALQFISQRRASGVGKP